VYVRNILPIYPDIAKYCRFQNVDTGSRIDIEMNKHKTAFFAGSAWRKYFRIVTVSYTLVMRDAASYNCWSSFVDKSTIAEQTLVLCGEGVRVRDDRGGNR
jgi:hypothetical protein